MKQVSEIISDEIDLIYNVLDAIIVIENRLLNNDSVELEGLQLLISNLRLFVQNCHHKKQELLLFPCLKKESQSLSQNLLDEMLSEKQLCAMYLKTMEYDLEAYALKNANKRKKMGELLLKYSRLLGTHIQKEQLFVLPILNQEISDASKQQLAEAFQESDEKSFDSVGLSSFYELSEAAFKQLADQYS